MKRTSSGFDHNKTHVTGFTSHKRQHVRGRASGSLCASEFRLDSGIPYPILGAPVAWRHGRTVEFPVVDWPGMTTVGNRSYDGCVHVSMRAMSTTASNGAERIREQYNASPFVIFSSCCHALSLAGCR